MCVDKEKPGLPGEIGEPVRLPRRLGLAMTRRQVISGFAGLALFGIRLPRIGENGKVVIVHGVKARSGFDLLGVVRGALDLGVGRLLGKKPEDAWREVTAAGAPLSVKVDALSPISSTGEELIIALLERLFDLLIQPWDITVWERRASDVLRRAYRLSTRRGETKVLSSERGNRRGEVNAPPGYDPSVRYRPSWPEAPVPEILFTEFLSPPPATLINLPAAKHHPLVGVDGALLSLALGAVSSTGEFHSSAEILAGAVAEIWQQEPLRGHALTIMDATTVVYHGGPVGLPAWSAEENALIIGTDPVAVDAVALDLIDARRVAAGLPSCKEEGNILLEKARELGIGSAEPEVIEVSAALSVPRGREAH